MNDHKSTSDLRDMLKIDLPVIMAPMFLVSNEAMLIAGMRSGIAVAIPALNYRTTDEMRESIRHIRREVQGSLGINLIVNRSNFLLNEQLNVCCEEKVDFIITSLGSPAEVIRRAHEVGILVFCDVTDAQYALKVQELGADAIIAVNKDAGGHAGSKSAAELIPELRSLCAIPIISAGGVATGAGIREVMNYGASGVSMGTLFIATNESGVSDEYKHACVQYGAKDIVLTTKLSGTPCTVINTSYVQRTGTEQNGLERLLNKNKRLKKWLKALVFLKGMKRLQKAAFSTTYRTVWCAGPVIEHVTEILPISEVIERLKKDFRDSTIP